MSGVPWNEYLAEVIVEEDKVLLQEAANAARANAPRSAYIAVWLACAESLKRKFREASSLDNEAAKVSGTIAALEKQQKAVDGYVLEEAKKYGFVSDSEHTELRSIYDLRCLYGHPYERQPLPEQLAAAAAVAVEYILGRTTKLRRGYLARQVGLLCKDLTFLDDIYGAVERHAKLIHAKSADDEHLWFLRKLWKTLLPIHEDATLVMIARRGTWFSAAFLKCCGESFLATWDAALDLPQYPFLAAVLSDTELYSKLSGHAKEIVVGDLLQWAPSAGWPLKTLEGMNAAGVLDARQASRFQQAVITDLPLDLVVASGLEPSTYFNRLVAMLKDYSYDPQNEAARAVRGLGAAGIAKLQPTQQYVLGNNILQAAEGNAFLAQACVGGVAMSHPPWPTAFIEGMLAECVVNDGNVVRFKNKCAKEVFAGLKTVDPSIRQDMVARIVARIQSGTVSDRFFTSRYRSEFVAILDEVIQSDRQSYACLESLRDVVSALEIPKNEFTF